MSGLSLPIKTGIALALVLSPLPVLAYLRAPAGQRRSRATTMGVVAWNVASGFVGGYMAGRLIQRVRQSDEH